MSPERVFLHIGLHKTGTTFLQSKFRTNAAELAEQGIYYPAGEGQPSQYQAVDDLQGRRPAKVADERSAGAWQTLVTAIRSSSLPSVLVSDERLSLSGMRAIGRVQEAFAFADLEVIVTVRDLARVLVSSWQEAIKGGATWTWEGYVAAVRDPAQRGVNPSRGFWTTQDLPQICAGWEAVVPAAKVHIVTVPHSGAGSDVVLRRVCDVIGADADALVHQPRVVNPSNDVAGIEMIRRLNERLHGRLNRRQYDRAVKIAIASQLPRRAAAAGVLPASELPWVLERAESDRKTIVERGYQVHGDLDDLLPEPATGRPPGQASEAEVLDAALDGLAAIAESYGRAWWARRQPDKVAASPAGRIPSRIRALGFRIRHRALAAADHVPALRGISALGMRLRQWRHDAAMRRARRRRGA